MSKDERRNKTMAIIKIILALMLTLNFIASMIGIVILKENDKNSFGIIWNTIVFILFAVIVANRSFF